MKIFRQFQIFFIVLAMSFAAKAQDIHFSMFDMAPIYLNAANTGAYEGTFRVGGLYRDQFNGIKGVSGYRTPTVYLDAPAFRLFGKYSWVGIGGSFLYDKRGSLSLSTMNSGLSLAFHFPLGKARKIYLSLGGGGGYTQDRFDAAGANPEDAITGGGTTQDNLLNGTSDDKVGFIDYNAGINLNVNVSRRFDFNIGFSSQHLVEPEESFASTGNTIRPRKYIGNIGMNIGLTEKFFIKPMAFYQMQLNQTELNTQALMGLHLNAEKDMTLLFGPGYRFNDASHAIARVGFKIKGLNIGAAYDINIGGLSNASNGNGGFEIGASYIAKIYRPKILPNRVFCPRL